MSDPRDAPDSRPVAPPPGDFVARRRVEFRDTDAAGIVHFSSYFVWMEAAEHDFLRAAGVRLVEPLPAAGTGGDARGPAVVSWPRVSATCDYVSAVRFEDEVDIHVGVEAIGRTSVTYVFRFQCRGRAVARGRVVAVRCVIRHGEAPVAVEVTPEIRARLTPFLVAATGTGPRRTDAAP